VGAPLLVVERPRGDGPWIAAGAAALALVLGLRLGAAMGALVPPSPYGHDLSTVQAGMRELELWDTGAGLALVLGASLGAWFSFARVRRVVIYEDVIDEHRLLIVRRQRWDGLQGYKDASGREVQLVALTRVLRVWTPDEKTREAVLGLVARNGLARLEL
jgi:hypothetical protein